MPRRNTKEIILERALELFSRRGYAGVSVRDIAVAVGIRESSLYKHFSGKRAIFDAIVEEMRGRYAAAERALRVPQAGEGDLAAAYGEIGPQQLAELCRKMFLHSTRDPYATQFRKMLTIEQYASPEVMATYRDFFLDGPIAFQTELFSQMIGQGYFRGGAQRPWPCSFTGPSSCCSPAVPGRRTRQTVWPCWSGMWPSSPPTTGAGQNNEHRGDR